MLLTRPIDAAAQMLWFLPGVGEERVGYDHGLLTWLRERRHRRLKRPVHICLVSQPVSHFARVTAFWLNERSKLCRATVNEGMAEADILWFYAQDPLGEDRQRLFSTLASIPCQWPRLVINSPARYDGYHGSDFFTMLSAAGVNVPRSTFTDEDIGRTQVVYKFQGLQDSPKRMATYEGHVPGWRAFEFVDSRDETDRFARYRAFYLLGIVRPAEVFFGKDWNVCLRTAEEIRYTFTLTEQEKEQIGLIAKTAGLDFFAVDFTRRRPDGAPVFVDVNVNPAVASFPRRSRDRRHLGQWHTFDTCRRLGLPEPLGRSMWELFDDAIATALRP